nr:unnamed protein product [Digitaria exilis]
MRLSCSRSGKLRGAPPASPSGKAQAPKEATRRVGQKRRSTGDRNQPSSVAVGSAPFSTKEHIGMQNRRPGSRWEERIPEISPAGMTRHKGGRPRVSTLRGAERQMWRHREERIRVRPPSLVGRSETMSPRMASGRRLM